MPKRINRNRKQWNNLYLDLLLRSRLSQRVLYYQTSLKSMLKMIQNKEVVAVE